MSSASILRRQIEANLANRIPSALTPAPRTIRPIASTGIQTVDQLLEGGLPLGAITEIVGPECSGRTSFALSVLAQMTQAEKVCAWIDVSDTLDPESAAAVGVDLSRLLWVRCGVQTMPEVRPSAQRTFSLPEKYMVPPPAKKGLHGGGFGSHPRNEVKGLCGDVSSLLKPGAFAPRCASGRTASIARKVCAWRKVRFATSSRAASTHSIGVSSRISSQGRNSVSNGSEKTASRFPPSWTTRQLRRVASAGARTPKSGSIRASSLSQMNR